MPQDLQHLLQVLFANQDLAFGVHEVDPAVTGNGNDGPSVRRFGAREGIDYEVSLVGDLADHILVPIDRFGHLASRGLRAIGNGWSARRGPVPAAETLMPSRPDASTEPIA